MGVTRTPMTTQTLHRHGLVQRAWAPVVVGALGATSVGALVVRDPHVPGAWGRCLFLQATGAWCPGCGGLRAINDLAHLDVAGALSSNAAAVIVVFVIAVWWVAWAWASLRGARLDWQRWFNGRTLGIAAAVWVVFSVLRNLPGFEALGP